MNLAEARGLAEQEILSRTGWSELPHDAVLTHAYLSRRGRWVFQWKRKTDLYSSEVDRLLVWVRDDGSIERVEISWFAPLEPKISESVKRILRSRGYTVATAPAQAIKEAVRKRAYEVTGRDIKILDWRRINRSEWVVKTSGNEFWAGKLSDDAYVLLSPDGEIVGWLILPTSAVAVSGFWGGSCNGDCPPCEGWWTCAKLVKSYVEKWFGKDAVVWGMCPQYDWETGTQDCREIGGPCESYISSADFKNAIKDHRCKFYYCIAHGDYQSAWLGNEQGTQIDICAVSGWWCDLVVKDLMANRGRMRLAFLGHCGAMESTGEGTFEYEFRKGKSEKTTVVGYKHGGYGYHTWTEAFLKDMDENRDKKIGDCFDDTCDLYPDSRDKIELTGDRDQTLRDIIQGDFCEITK